MASIKNHNGFTFISLIFAISMLILLLPFLSFLLQSTVFTTKYDEYSVLHFFYYLRDDTILATEYTLNNNVITFTLHSGEKATISQYKQLIRRQVDGQGHEIYLRDIERMDVEHTPFGFRVLIKTLQGDLYEKSFAFYEK